MNDKNLKDIIIGVLALQGAFREHVEAIKKLKVKAIEIRNTGQLKGIDGLIIPGGESTTIYKLLTKYSFKPALERFISLKKPIFGTCAGLVILARKVINEDFGYGFMDIVVDRNAYGRQVDSFESLLDLKGEERLNHRKFNAVFIRAPKIIRAGINVKILGTLDDDIVIARENNILVCSFHPELTGDLRIHRYFIDMVKNSKNVKI